MVVYFPCSHHHDRNSLSDLLKVYPGQDIPGNFDGESVVRKAVYYERMVHMYYTYPELSYSRIRHDR